MLWNVYSEGVDAVPEPADPARNEEIQMRQLPRVFTKQQVANYRAYEKVRAEGLFNMFDNRARQLTGLSGDAYSFVMQNFEALREFAEKD